MLDPAAIPGSGMEYAATLDGMEKLAEPMTLAHMMEEKIKVNLLVTGAGAINLDGVRYGKGHGFFDLEWGILYTLDIITPQTPTLVIAHDCQVLNTLLDPEIFDTACDVIATPTQIIEVSNAKKPVCGILWQHLAEGMIDNIPPLKELRDLITSKKIVQPQLLH